MNILLVTPVPPGSRQGNRVTALRWAKLLRALGHRATIDTEYRGRKCDVLIALHARKSHSAIVRYRAEHPDRPLILCLTGTDVYGDIHTSPEARQSLELATRLVVLQPLAIAELPPHLHDRACVIYQSVEAPRVGEAPRPGVFEVCVMGHLRAVKDPMRTALAARLLPPSSQVRVLHLGSALSKDMAEAARTEEANNSRYHWLGERPRREALRILSRCRLLVLTSQMEGGANVISEGLVLEVPVLSSHISGSIGLLGEDYPGFFPYGDTQGLADLLNRAETDADFYRELQEHCARLRPRFEPKHELESWRQLLTKLFP